MGRKTSNRAIWTAWRRFLRMGEQGPCGGTDCRTPEVLPRFSAAKIPPGSNLSTSTCGLVSVRSAESRRTTSPYRRSPYQSSYAQRYCGHFRNNPPALKDPLHDRSHSLHVRGLLRLLLLLLYPPSCMPIIPLLSSLPQGAHYLDPVLAVELSLKLSTSMKLDFTARQGRPLSPT